MEDAQNAQVTMAEMRTYVQGLAQQMQALQQENAEARTTIEQLRSQQQESLRIPTPIQNTTPTSYESLPDLRTTIARQARAKFPEIAYYTHENPMLYTAFLINLETKWRIDDAIYATPEEKVLYGFSRLQAKAAIKIQPWLETKLKMGTPLRTEEFREILDRAFKDPDVQSKALSKLNRTKQGTRDIRDFLSDFDRMLMEAGAWECPDLIKIGYLEASLNIDL